MCVLLNISTQHYGVDLHQVASGRPLIVYGTPKTRKEVKKISDDRKKTSVEK